jgi:hypothetical protein
MWRFGYDANASFILTIALLSMLGAVIVWQQHRTQKTILVWFWAAFFGIFLGCSATFALVRITDGSLLRPSSVGEVAAEGESSPAGESEGMAAPGGGTEGGMGGGRGGPRPKRDLTSVVQKVALLTGDISLSLSAEQASAFVAALKDIEQAETMSDEEAQAKHDELLALLTDEQKLQLEAIGIPRPRPTSSPGGGGERPAEDANPFAQEVNSTAIVVLRERFAGKNGE